MNKIKLILTHVFGVHCAAMRVDRVHSASFIEFNKIHVAHAIRDDFVFSVDIDNNTVWCHEIQIIHPTEKKEWFFGLGASTGEVNGMIEDWLSLFKEEYE